MAFYTPQIKKEITNPNKYKAARLASLKSLYTGPKKGLFYCGLNCPGTAAAGPVVLLSRLYIAIVAAYKAQIAPQKSKVIYRRVATKSALKSRIQSHDIFLIF